MCSFTSGPSFYCATGSESVFMSPTCHFYQDYFMTFWSQVLWYLYVIQLWCKRYKIIFIYLGYFAMRYKFTACNFNFLWKMPLNCNRHHMESTAHFRKCGICAMLILLIHEHRIPFWLFFHQLQLYFIVFITRIFYSPWKNVYHK